LRTRDRNIKENVNSKRKRGSNEKQTTKNTAEPFLHRKAARSRKREAKDRAKKQEKHKTGNAMPRQ
jgi:hypothetical protein